MSEQPGSIDLRTLEEVHRLLAASDFATADDLLDRSGGPIEFEPMVFPRPLSTSSHARPLHSPGDADHQAVTL